MADQGGYGSGNESLVGMQVKRDLYYDPSTYKPYVTKDPGKFTYSGGGYNQGGGVDIMKEGKRIYTGQRKVYNISGEGTNTTGLTYYMGDKQGRSIGKQASEGAIAYAKYLAQVDAYNAYMSSQKAASAPADKPKAKPPAGSLITPPTGGIVPNPPDKAKPLPDNPNPSNPNLGGGMGGGVRPPVVNPDGGEGAEERQQFLAPTWVNRKKRPQSSDGESLVSYGSRAGATATEQKMSRSLISSRVYEPGGRIYR